MAEGNNHKKIERLKYVTGHADIQTCINSRCSRKRHDDWERRRELSEKNEMQWEYSLHSLAPLMPMITTDRESDGLRWVLLVLQH